MKSLYFPVARAALSACMLAVAILLTAQDHTRPELAGPGKNLAVNPYNGNLHFTMNAEGFRSPSIAIDGLLVFHYNSGRTQKDVGMGPGWSHSFAMEQYPEAAPGMDR